MTSRTSDPFVDTPASAARLLFSWPQSLWWAVLLLFLLPMGSRPVGLLWWHIPLIGLGKQTDLLVAGGRTAVT